MNNLRFVLKYGKDGVHYDMNHMLDSNLSDIEQVFIYPHCINNTERIKKVFGDQKHKIIISNMLTTSHQNRLSEEQTDLLRGIDSKNIRRYLISSHHKLSSDHIDDLSKHEDARLNLINYRWKDMNTNQKHDMLNHDDIAVRIRAKLVV